MNRPEIVAELGASHRGDLQTAIRLVNLAAEAGADAIKLQTYNPAAMVGGPNLKIEAGPWAGESLFELYQRAHTPREWHERLARLAADLGLGWFSSVFSLDDLAFLEAIGCPRYKIASFELVDIELIEAAAATGKPVVLSSGMAFAEEIDAAVDAYLGSSPEGPPVTVLICTSAYPAPPARVNLLRMRYLRRGVTLPGLSDHTIGSSAAMAATAMGAVMIEKHLTDSRAHGGPDGGFASEPAEFAKMVADVRLVTEMLGNGFFEPIPEEVPQRRLRRSLWWAATLEPGQRVDRVDVRSARPADGLRPYLLPTILGKRVVRRVLAGDPVQAQDFEFVAAVV